MVLLLYSNGIILCMNERVSRLFEQTRERVLGPRTVNFGKGMELVVVINQDEPSVILQETGTPVLDFRSFAPEGTRLVFSPSDKWGADPRIGSNNPPRLSIGKFKGPQAVLDFLHECGHLHDAASVDLAKTAEDRYAQQYFGKSPNDVSPERLEALSIRHQMIQYAERNAWEYSLSRVRELDERFGLDIIGKMGGEYGVVSYINFFLRNYEQHTKTELEYLGFGLIVPEEVSRIFQVQPAKLSLT